MRITRRVVRITMLAFAMLALLGLTANFRVQGAMPGQIDLVCPTSTISFGNGAASASGCGNKNVVPVEGGRSSVVLVKSVQTLDIASSTSDDAINEILILNAKDASAIVRVEASSFTSLKSLSSLRFEDVRFNVTALTLTVPSTLSYLKLVNTGLNDLSLTVPSNSSKIVLNQVVLTGNEFTQLPKLFYEREYLKPLNITDLVIRPGAKPLALSVSTFINAQKNLGGNNIYVDFSSDCSFNPSTSKASICSDSNILGPGTTPDISDTNDTPTPTPSTTSRKHSSDTTLTIIVIAIALVALGLAYFVARRYFCITPRSRTHSPRSPNHAATTNLISKDDTAQGNKLSFISSDDALRDLRLEQQEIQLTKSVGIGRLWVGEYKSKKVIIKRIEAENSDSYVTKELTNQARSLATLHHDHIVKMMGVTWIQGTDFAIVGEFMDKGTLKSALMDNTLDLDLHTKIDMCRDVAHALAYLHSMDMYMERLSSRKVLVNSSMTCKLNLFECHPIPKTLEIPEIFGAGDMAWWAPELITRTSPLSARKVNIFSLGVLMSEILVRVSPYQSDIDRHGHTLTDLELVKRIRRQETLLPHDNCELYRDAPILLREMIERCLGYHPMERPTADEVVGCLDMIKNASIHGSTTSL